MIRNVKLKNFLINKVFVIFSLLNKWIPKKETKILLYSNMGFRDNIESLYQHLVENGYNEKYQIICSTSDWKKQSAIAKNVRFTSPLKGGLHYFTASKIYYCFGRIPIKPAKNQISIQMWHGTSFKGFDQSTQKTNSFDKQFYTWTFASSEFFRPIVSRKFSVPEKNVWICGHPRTDVFYDKTVLNEQKPYIVWLPTFRQSSITGYSDSELGSSLPIFSETADWEALDQKLEETGTELAVKLHPLQDAVQLTKKSFKHIKIYDQERFKSENLDLYTWLADSAALLTDYSSVFYDYLLLDRPIGFTEDDMESYQDTRGFAVDDPDWFRPGARLKTPEDVYHFIEDISMAKDDFVERRKEVNDRVNAYQDGNNCQRALALAQISLD